MSKPKELFLISLDDTEICINQDSTVFVSTSTDKIIELLQDEHNIEGHDGTTVYKLVPVGTIKSSASFIPNRSR